MSARPTWLPKARLPRPIGQSPYAYTGPRAPKPSAPPAPYPSAPPAPYPSAPPAPYPSAPPAPYPSAPQPSAPPAPAPWTCTTCAQQNYGGSTTCASCGTKAPDWTCYICTLENHGSSASCVACGFERGSITITLVPVSSGPSFPLTTQYIVTINDLLVFLAEKTGQSKTRIHVVSHDHRVLEPHRTLASYGITSGPITYVINPLKGGTRSSKRRKTYRRQKI